MRFEEVYTEWRDRRLTQSEAARLLGVFDRTLRRQIERYEADGLAGLIDKRLDQISHKRAPVDEVMGVVQRYRRDYAGWNVRHFHSWYRREHSGERSYTWVKNTLQQAGEIKRAKARGKHRKKRERAPLRGMLVHQDASRHEWLTGHDWDLVVTMDDATGEHLSMFFCNEESTASSFHGVGQTIARHGLFCALYTDRGSHYFHTPEAGGKVDRDNPTQFGRAFGTHQERLPRELAKAGITCMQQANDYLEQVYMPRHNAEFAVVAAEPGSAFVPYIGNNLPDILCEHHERTVGNDNCVSFERLKLQIPPDGARPHYVKRRVRVCRYVDATLAVFYGPRCLGRYDACGTLRDDPIQLAA